MKPTTSFRIHTFWYHIKRWLLTEWRFHLAVGIIIPALSLFYAWAADRSDIFARAGSVMCLTGGFMSFRRYLRGAEHSFLRDTGIADQPAFRNLDPANARMDARANDFTAMGWGICFVILGTGIWGYGDLLLKWTYICSK